MYWEPQHSNRPEPRELSQALSSLTLSSAAPVQPRRSWALGLPRSVTQIIRLAWLDLVA